MILALLVGCSTDGGPMSRVAPDGAAAGALDGGATVGGGQGTVVGTAGAGLNVREAPNTSSAVVGLLDDGATFTIYCQVRGEPVGSHDVWHYVADEAGYVSDAFVDTGHDGFVPGVPRCDDPGDGAGDDDGHGAVPGGAGDRLTIGQIVGGVDHRVSQDYGPTTFDGGYSYCHAYGDWGGRLVHCGLDIAIPYGTPLYVPEGGTVAISGETPYFEDATNPAAGELRIRTADGTEIILGHMSHIDLVTGESVEAGRRAGLSGTQNGPHLHLEVRVPAGGGLETVDPVVHFGP